MPMLYFEVGQTVLLKSKLNQEEITVNVNRQITRSETESITTTKKETVNVNRQITRSEIESLTKKKEKNCRGPV